MDPAKIGKAYDQITHLWQRDGFNRQNGIEQHQRALVFVKNKYHALDVGCGCTGRFIDLLLEQNFNVEGVDISDQMIKLAKQRHPNITFYHQDICQWQPPKKYDFITAWDSIWHIPLEQQQQVISKLVNSLTPNGILIFSFGGTDEPGEHSNNAMGPEVYYSSLGVNGFLALLIELGCLVKHLEYDQYPELHSYLIVEKIS